MMYHERQREADLRDLEERYASDSAEAVLEQITEDGTVEGKISLERVRTYLRRQINEIITTRQESRRFFEEVEEAKQRGATHSQIWGDNDHVSFPEMLHIQAGRARDNIDLCKKICEEHGIWVNIKEWKETRMDAEVEFARD